MEFIWIGFIWVVVALIYFGSKWIKEKEASLQISDEGMKKYRGKHFRKSSKWGFKWYVR